MSSASAYNSAMDDEPWQDPEPGWQLPRSWSEVRERWPADSALRMLVGVLVVIALVAFFMCSGLRLS